MLSHILIFRSQIEIGLGMLTLALKIWGKEAVESKWGLHSFSRQGCSPQKLNGHGPLSSQLRLSYILNIKHIKGGEGVKFISHAHVDDDHVVSRVA